MRKFICNLFNLHKPEIISYFSETTNISKCSKCGTLLLYNAYFNHYLKFDRDAERVIKTCYPEHEFFSREYKLEK